MEVTITTENFESYKNGELICGLHGVVLAVRLLLSCQNWQRSLMVKSLLVSVM